jgi:hypothetical protein
MTGLFSSCGLGCRRTARSTISRGQLDLPLASGRIVGIHVGRAFLSRLVGVFQKVWCSVGGSKSNTINLILRLFLYHFLHMTTLTDESQVVRPHKKHKRPYKHHHHGGRAACPSSCMSLLNPHHQRGGWPCAYLFWRPPSNSLAIIKKIK